MLIEFYASPRNIDHHSWITRFHLSHLLLLLLPLCSSPTLLFPHNLSSLTIVLFHLSPSSSSPLSSFKVFPYRPLSQRPFQTKINLIWVQPPRIHDDDEEEEARRRRRKRKKNHDVAFILLLLNHLRFHHLFFSVIFTRGK